LKKICFDHPKFIVPLTSIQNHTTNTRGERTTYIKTTYNKNISEAHSGDHGAHVLGTATISKNKVQVNAN